MAKKKAKCTLCRFYVVRLEEIAGHIYVWEGRIRTPGYGYALGAHRTKAAVKHGLRRIAESLGWEITEWEQVRCSRY